MEEINAQLDALLLGGELKQNSLRTNMAVSVASKLRAENESLNQMYSELYEHHVSEFHSGELAETEYLRDGLERYRLALEQIALGQYTASVCKLIAEKALEI